MATERDLDLLDDYVSNRMKGGERSAFEKRLESDPELKSELQMQERMVQAIKSARTAELKTMLNNIPVTPVNYGMSVGAKFAIGTFVAGVVAAGLYFYASEDEAITPPQEIVEELPRVGEPSIPADLEENTTNEEMVAGDIDKTPPATENAKSPESSDDAVVSKEPSQRVPEVYDPSSEVNEETEIEEAAGERRSSVRAGAPSIIVEIDRENRRYDFNYQFKNGKLVLYGPFEKNLYEILEFFTDEKRTAFLYYKNNFYLLNDSNDNVQDLVPVTDAALLRKLKEYRGK